MREGKEEGTKKNVQRTNLNDFGLGEVFNLARCYLISKVSLCLEGAFIPFFFFSLEMNYSTGPLVIQLNHAVVDAKVPLGL